MGSWGNMGSGNMGSRKYGVRNLFRIRFGQEIEDDVHLTDTGGLHRPGGGPEQ